MNFAYCRTYILESITVGDLDWTCHCFWGCKWLCISLPYCLNVRLRSHLVTRKSNQYREEIHRRFDYSRLSENVYVRAPDSSVPAASSLIEARSSVADIYAATRIPLIAISRHRSLILWGITLAETAHSRTLSQVRMNMKRVVNEIATPVVPSFGIPV
jgi:hypothetical protein